MIVEAEGRSTVALWRAVITQALDDATMFGSTNKAKLAISQARSWLLSPNQHFNEVCALADLEPSRVRMLARKRIAEADAQIAERTAAYELKVERIRRGHEKRKANRGEVANFSNDAQHRHSPAAQETT